MTGIESAILAAGGQSALAEILGVSQQNVSVWKRNGYVPTAWVVPVEQATGVPRAELISPRLRDLVVNLPGFD